MSGICCLWDKRIILGLYVLLILSPFKNQRLLLIYSLLFAILSCPFCLVTLQISSSYELLFLFLTFSFSSGKSFVTEYVMLISS